MTDAAPPPTTALVVGGGSAGQRHLRNLASLGVGRLIAVDPDPARRPALEAIAAEVHEELHDGLASKPEVVVVATAQGGWLRVRAPSGQEGWVLRRWLRLATEKP